jgi:endonuclease/exonuclease/phosphatase family metal-dependent hydrolase
MTVRIPTNNTENLFRRPKVFALPDDKQRRQVLEDYAELIALLDRDPYTEADQLRMAELIKKYRLYDDNAERPFVINETRGVHTLYRTGPPADDPHIEFVAHGRSGWTGWVELVRDDIDWTAVRNTARVIAEVDADVLLVQEVEDRLTLQRFNKQVLGAALGGRPYPYTMVIDGNDTRGIDVGVLSRHPITSLRSHIFDQRPDGRPVFSRDCPEYEIAVDGTPLWLLGNHFKSQLHGGGAELRLAQAERVVRIYEAARARSARVLVAGDLNDSPGSAPITTLRATGLRDAMSHPDYRGDPGTHHTGRSDRDKLDYLFFPPELWERIQHVGVERRGIWAPRAFKSFETVTSKATEASDHAALYADLDL